MKQTKAMHDANRYIPLENSIEEYILYGRAKPKAPNPETSKPAVKATPPKENPEDRFFVISKTF